MNWITPYRLGPEDRPHRRALYMALVQELYRRGKVPVLILLGFMGVFYFLLREAAVASTWVRVLFPCLVGVLILRGGLCLQGDRLQGRHHRIHSRYTLYFSGVLLTGLLLGCLGFAAFRSLDPGQFLLLCLCYLGI